MKQRMSGHMAHLPDPLWEVVPLSGRDTGMACSSPHPKELRPTTDGQSYRSVSQDVEMDSFRVQAGMLGITLDQFGHRPRGDSLVKRLRYRIPSSCSRRAICTSKGSLRPICRPARAPSSPVLLNEVCQWFEDLDYRSLLPLTY